MNRQIVVAEIPDGPVEARHFREVVAPIPDPGPGELLCRIASKPDVLRELGFVALDRRSDRFASDLKAACPDGIDVYFDNTGGEILEAVLFRMNQGGAIACCGVVSQYDTATPHRGRGGCPASW